MTTYHLNVFAGEQDKKSNVLMHFDVQATSIEQARETLYQALKGTRYEAIEPGCFPIVIRLRYLSFVTHRDKIEYAGEEQTFIAGNEPVGVTPLENVRR